MNRQEAFNEINKIQDDYIDELINLMESPEYAAMKIINFTSATGTGKTKMMSKLINRFPEYYFIVTTLSKGQLHMQIRNALAEDCQQDNFYVYGSADYKINSILDAEDIIGRIPEDTRCIWLRDEGHIKTNRFDELLRDVCYKVINFSATNEYSDIQCNFTQTMMLRTVEQNTGTPEDAIKKLLEIKEAHKGISGYNPCGIFRCVGGNDVIYQNIIDLCEKYNLKYTDISYDDYVMAELCQDDNEYDVIINKFKIVEGIDIRRAHVLYMDNQPKNAATTIQVIGRCRRNALLYRNDIDILSRENQKLLEETRKCYVYYNVKDMSIDTDSTGELYYAFCDHISCESLKCGSTVSVTNGQLPNGLYVLELEGKTGDFNIVQDPETGFNIVEPISEFYEFSEKKFNEYLYTQEYKKDKLTYKKIHIDNVPHLPINNKDTNEPYYKISADDQRAYNTIFPEAVSESVLNYFDFKMENYQNSTIKKTLSSIRVENIIQKHVPKITDKEIADYIRRRQNRENWKKRLQENSLDFSLDFNAYEIKDITSDPYTLKTVPDLMDENSRRYLLYCCMEYLKREQSWHSEMYLSQLLRKKIETICTIILLLKADKDVKLVNAVIFNVFESNINIFQNNINGFYSFAPIQFCYDKNDLISRLHKQAYIKVRKVSGMRVLDKSVPINDVTVKPAHINAYFKAIKDITDSILTVNLSSDDITESIFNYISQTRERLQNNIIDEVYLSYDELFEPVTQEENDALNEGKLQTTWHISKSKFKQYVSYRHNAIINDKESAIIGTDLMQLVKIGKESVWTEMRAVSAKIGTHNKFNQFISNRYYPELKKGKPQLFTGKNNFKFNTKCNAMIGYCVEYYSKYIVYGPTYLGNFLNIALSEFKTKTITDAVVVRACMLKYKDVMQRSYGQKIGRLIRTASAQALVQENYNEFISLVVTLGTRTANYVQKALYLDRPAEDNVDPNLTIRHIAGVADYITTDTILDVKVKNCIDEKCLRQVLAYHYLSTKRSDLHIKKVIVYDATSDRAVVVDIEENRDLTYRASNKDLHKHLGKSAFKEVKNLKKTDINKAVSDVLEDIKKNMQSHSPRTDLWTDEEVELLKEFYLSTKMSELKEIFPNRSEDAIKRKALNLGMRKTSTPSNAWTTEEMEILCKYYPIEGLKVAERLPGRSPDTCRTVANKNGIYMNKQ